MTITLTNEQERAVERDLEPIPEIDLYERYDEMLDDCYEIIRIGTMEYCPSNVLREVDPIAYRCGFNDWLDSEMRDDYVVEVNGEYYDAEKVEEIIAREEEKEEDAANG